MLPVLMHGAAFAAGLPAASVTANTWWHSKAAPYGGASLISDQNSTGTASYNYDGNQYFNAVFAAKAQSESGPLPYLYIENSVTTGWDTSFSYTESVETQATFTYYFSIDGPASGLLATVHVGGAHINKASGGLTSATVAVEGPGNGFPSMGFSGCSTNQCESQGWFFSELEVKTGALYKVTMSADIIALAQGGGQTASASAYIDPYISVDDAWALSHQGFSVLVSDGIGNVAPTAAIPEPAEYMLLLLGLGVFWLSRDRVSAAGR